jgi:hypothetical protein
LIRCVQRSIRFITCHQIRIGNKWNAISYQISISIFNTLIPVSLLKPFVNNQSSFVKRSEMFGYLS